LIGAKSPVGFLRRISAPQERLAVRHHFWQGGERELGEWFFIDSTSFLAKTKNAGHTGIPLKLGIALVSGTLAIKYSVVLDAYFVIT